MELVCNLREEGEWPCMGISALGYIYGHGKIQQLNKNAFHIMVANSIRAVTTSFLQVLNMKFFHNVYSTT